ncbi:MAG: hypothetical protein KC503_33865 [Myxococcales bacterium]|nr:hypothetical protein [Myxococcales bacterium]
MKRSVIAIGALALLACGCGESRLVINLAVAPEDTPSRISTVQLVLDAPGGFPLQEANNGRVAASDIDGDSEIELVYEEPADGGSALPSIRLLPGTSQRYYETFYLTARGLKTNGSQLLVSDVAATNFVHGEERRLTMLLRTLPGAPPDPPTPPGPPLTPPTGPDYSRSLPPYATCTGSVESFTRDASSAPGGGQPALHVVVSALFASKNKAPIDVTVKRPGKSILALVSFADASWHVVAEGGEIERIITLGRGKVSVDAPAGVAVETAPPDWPVPTEAWPRLAMARFFAQLEAHTTRRVTSYRQCATGVSFEIGDDLTLPALPAPGVPVKAERFAQLQTAKGALRPANVAISTDGRSVRANDVGSVPVAFADIAQQHGKWYFEVELTKLAAASKRPTRAVGVTSPGATSGNSPIFLGSALTCRVDASLSAGCGGPPVAKPSAVAVGSVIGVAVDADAGRVYFRHDGAWLDDRTPVAGNGHSQILSSVPRSYVPFVTLELGDNATFNFGSEPFAHAPPAGYFKGWYTSKTRTPTSAATAPRAQGDAPIVGGFLRADVAADTCANALPVNLADGLALVQVDVSAASNNVTRCWSPLPEVVISLEHQGSYYASSMANGLLAVNYFETCTTTPSCQSPWAGNIGHWSQGAAPGSLKLFVARDPLDGPMVLMLAP